MLTREQIEKATNKYFENHNIEDLMDFGATADEGLNDISEPYVEILGNLNINVGCHEAVDGISDGKYDIFIELPESDDKVALQVKAWYTAKEVAEDIFDLLETCGLAK